MTKVAGSPVLFDRSLLRQRRLRAQRGEPVTFLLNHVAADLIERLSVVKRSFAIAADIGTPTSALRNLMREQNLAEMIIGVDALFPASPNPSTIAADEEALPFADASLDLAVSALALQWVNDLPGTLAQIRRALKPDGLFLAALLGGETLTELRQSFAAAEAEIEGGVSPRVAPFADMRDIGALLQRAGFALPVADIDRLIVRYDTPFGLMQDLRGMGATNVLLERRRTPLKRATLQRMAQIYAERFSDPDGRLRTTFDIVWLSGWAPHESQQQPLRPGSARTRLADALKTTEFPAGEKSGSR
ncbi:methyltransferase domain-containing protein [Pseudorhodoplanes sinuspersici]|uniref:SAM-dependent methyltransferase n=1 Tax=Pseudorhodoplanes sinuspersici TaxID=1235591 RepID=A0A1W6ZPY3_9HYPH|nr:methyltransferase domain-containing protein [Pseudorhodoplanes sinuspersici]ARP99453.1 SAM-dependent methyltransferase [Pseudorhodoplanes sinuspersici]